MSESLLLGDTEAGRVAGLGARRIRQLKAAGALEYVQVGKRKLVVRQSVVEFVERRRQRAVPPADTAREKLRAMARRRNRGSV